MGTMAVLALLLLAIFLVLVVPALAIYAVARAHSHGRDLARLEHIARTLAARVQALEGTVRRLEAPQAPPHAAGTPAPAEQPQAAPTPPGPHAPAAALDRPPALAVPVPRPTALTPQPAASALARAAATAAPAPRQPWRAEALDWESLIAGRWLNVIGIAALLLASAFFLRYAFENDWIGPAGRVALGLVAGTALLVTSEWLFRRGHAFFSDGLAGLAGGVLYLSFYAAWGYYELFPQAAAFGGMTAVTAALMIVAAGRRSERIALVALAGGFAAPVLLRTGTNQQLVLFSYVAALDAGALLLSRLRQWRAVDAAAFGGTQVLFWGWYFSYWTPAQLLPTAVFATLFFLLFAAISIDRLRRAEVLPAAPLVLLLSNAFAYLFALRAMLWPAHRWALTVAVLALAAAHLAAARLAFPGTSAAIPLLRMIHAGMALAFATLAIPIRLEGRWITVAWAVEGAVLVWSGVATRLAWLRAAGLGLLAIGVVRLLMVPAPADRFLANPRFLTLVTVGVCLAAAVWFGRRREADFPGEPLLYGVAAVAANVLFVGALTADVWDWIGRMERPLGLTPSDLRELAIPVLWAVYGTSLVLLGLRFGHRGLRWMGLPLMGMAAGALLVQTSRPEVVLANPRFAAFLAAAACVLIAAFAARRAASVFPEAERMIYRAAPVVFCLLLLVALSHEVWDLFGRGRALADVRYAQSMGLSILWAAYATALIVAGVRAADPALRWMALLLFGIVVIKVFFFDLSALDRGYRILSFFVLGVLLLAVSFLYTRRLTAARGEGPT